MPTHKKTTALIILDGWGYREATDNNAIAQAHKPCWDTLWQTCPHTLISGSGRCVGLPNGQMGNSEVGHLNMGAGRILHQDLTRIDSAISEGTFFNNAVLTAAVDHAVTHDKAIHILGLISDGGVHSQATHIAAMITLAAQRGAKKVYLHAFLDGRDTPPKSAATTLSMLDAHCKALGVGKIASLIGRYYAMDRDQRWERIEKAWSLLVLGKADYTASDALAGLHAAYARNETDEFVQATTLRATDEAAITLGDDESVIFMNFRADRAREITHALNDTSFTHFDRPRCPRLHFVTLTEYDARFPFPIAFSPERPQHILGEYLSELGMTQLRIAETEKYAHVTFFFNGGVEPPFPGEDRLLIPSPKVATYDLQPEMSAPALTDALIAAIARQQYDVIICNFANPDMVGHTGKLDATIKAIETIDACLTRIVTALRAVGGEALITADHGNAELLFDPATGQPHTAHTSEPVPVLYVGRSARVIKNDGKLSDIAPTLLTLLGLAIPIEMTGQPLFELT